MSLKNDVAREYRTKWPKKPTLALARIMHQENKKLFKDVDDARYKLRYIEGKSGARNKKHVANSEFFKEEPRPYNPYKLPDSDETTYEPYILKGFKKVALFSDIHVPYHSITAITSALDFCKKEKVDLLILNGDLFDFHGLSRFMKDPRKKSFAEELAIGVDLVQKIHQVLKCKIIFKLGNHDERYQHYLFQKLGELHGVEDFEFRNIIKKRLPDIDVVEDKRIIKANGLNIIHGHEFGQQVFSPVNIARGLYNKGKACAIQGHNHQVSEHTEPDMNENITTTWSTGCLCELHPAYLPINKWAHGFAIVELSNGKFHLRNFRIKKGQIL